MGNLNGFSRSISAWLLKFMIHHQDIGFSEENVNKDLKFVLIPPPLGICFLIFINPRYWVAESYSRGHWSLKKGDLSLFLTYVSQNTTNKYHWYFEYQRKRTSLNHVLKQKIFTKYFSRKVTSHYNLDPEIYSCFLDKEMVYTCAFYDKNESLEEAQQNKFSTITRRLGCDSGSTFLLNIGCGWGSFERHIVRNNPSIKVTGLSISKAQIDWTKNYHSQHLNEQEIQRINLLMEDYIDHNPETNYDFITAVGMVEHIGQQGYDEFLNKCYSILKPGGKLLIHMIVKAESDIPTNRWIDKFIFPGGYAPSINEVINASENTDFRIENVHIHHPKNYKKTLQKWRSNLEINKKKVLALYKSKFDIDEQTANYYYRQWEIYFAGSESTFSFEVKPQQIAQFVFEKLPKK